MLLCPSSPVVPLPTPRINLPSLFSRHIPSYVEGIRHYFLNTLLPRLQQSEPLTPLSDRILHSDAVQVVLIYAVSVVESFQKVSTGDNLDHICLFARRAITSPLFQFGRYQCGRCRVTSRRVTSHRVASHRSATIVSFGRCPCIVMSDSRVVCGCGLCESHSQATRACE